MKILFVQTNYPKFLSNFYKNTKNIQRRSYKQTKVAWAKEFFGSSDFYLKNLHNLGWTGDEIILNDWNIQSKWMEEHNFKIRNSEAPFSKFMPPRIKNLFGLNGWMKEIFFKQVEYLMPDIVYLHDMTIFNEHDIEKIKKYAKLVVGQIAYPLPLNESILTSYDLIISSFPHFVRKFKKMGIKSEYLKWCVEKTIPSKIGKKKRIYDVSYVGGFTPHHSHGNKILETVAKEIKVDFWGYGDSFLSPLSSIKNNFHGEAWGKEMYEIFAKSKIVINRHINISKNYANNMRMFDATAMGALLITDAKSNMSEFFKVGTEVVVYKNAQDLIKKIKYYLNHPEGREKIAKAGQKRTLKEHTYRVRMNELDKILKKYI